MVTAIPGLICTNDEKFVSDMLLYTLGYLLAFPSHMQARKLKTLLETTFGWDLEDNAMNLIDEDDEVRLDHDLSNTMSLLHFSEIILCMSAVCSCGCGNGCVVG